MKRINFHVCRKLPLIPYEIQWKFPYDLNRYVTLITLSLSKNDYLVSEELLLNEKSYTLQTNYIYSKSPSQTVEPPEERPTELPENIITTYDNTTLEQGTLTRYGKEDNTTRIRTKEYFIVNPNIYYKLAINATFSSPYLDLMFYDSNYTKTGEVEWTQTDTLYFYPPTNTTYMGIVIRKSSGNIVPEEVNDYTLTVYSDIEPWQKVNEVLYSGNQVYALTQTKTVVPITS